VTLTMVVRRMSRKQDGTQRYLDPKSQKVAVPHGFRRTFLEWCFYANVYPRKIVERALGRAVVYATEEE
jgi:integrase